MAKQEMIEAMLQHVRETVPEREREFCGLLTTHDFCEMSQDWSRQTGFAGLYVPADDTIIVLDLGDGWRIANTYLHEVAHRILALKGHDPSGSGHDRAFLDLCYALQVRFRCLSGGVQSHAYDSQDAGRVSFFDASRAAERRAADDYFDPDAIAEGHVSRILRESLRVLVVAAAVFVVIALMMSTDIIADLRAIIDSAAGTLLVGLGFAGWLLWTFRRQ